MSGAHAARNRWAILCGALLAAAALLARALTPSVTVESYPSGLLAGGLPRQFDGWELVASPLPLVDLQVAAGGQRTNDNPYDEVIAETFADARGRSIMLAVAYAAEQRQDIKIHRPDLCYPSQGFRVTQWAEQPLPGIEGPRGPISGVRMLTRRGDQREAVLYWLRTADDYGQSMWSGRLALMREGLRGRVPDGALVRASMRIGRDEDAPQAFELMGRFLAALVAHSAPEVRARLMR